MADEVILEYLHMEIISQFYRSCEKSDQDQCIAKLESLGFRIGQSLVERFTKESPRFKDELDTMKFICKDFWNYVYKKQIDNLRTNHQGVYVLQDNKFRFLTQMSNGKQFMEAAPKFLALPCGMIRGALSNLGVNCVVTAEVSAMPACKFQIQIQRA
ncbi:trafficking protein particle complex subunit 6b-like [Crassostrea angulata]|uniref:Trafficking protein particle complex subunit 6B n=2 Tax=Magallana gigas TaxID=29159 RepID=K1R003_MAGGI|nr:trafficking protein particle complex subunit 6b [Crassostrea gigas]XP_052701780.1 trafficking protein particle complex subunit 6b-like [Crassostrea angulata]|eukprot:XP_011420192.1 PREDICTED: trafficking protein particle complex subunit 6B [Crassostrea gigas]